MRADRRRTAMALGFLAIVYAVLVFGVLPRHVFFSPDEGDKFIATASAVRRGDLWDVAYEYPGQDLDPEGQFFFSEWVRVVKGQPVPFHLSTLTFVNGPLYRLWGINGLYVLPLLSGLGVAWLAYRIAQLLQVPQAWATCLLVGLGTPMFFFSLTTWDHAPTVFYSTLIVYLLARQTYQYRWWEMALAGAVIGLGLWTRFEMYLFAVAVGLAYLYVFWRQRMMWPGLGALAAGFAVVFVAMMAQQGTVYGELGILPLAVRASTVAIDQQEAASTVEVIRNVVLRQARVLLALTLDSPSIWLERVLLALAFVGVIVVNRFEKLRRRPAWALGSVLLQGVGTILAIVHRRLPETIVGLIPTLPLASLGLVYVSPRVNEERPPQRLALDLVATVSVSFLLLGLFLLPSFGGPSWGPRYLSPLFPLLAVLAWATTKRVSSGAAFQAQRPDASASSQWAGRNAVYAALGGVLVLSTIMQCVGVYFLYDYKQDMLGWYDGTRALDAYYVLSDSHWFLRQVSGLYLDRCFYFLSTRAKYETLVERLYRKGVERFAWVAASDTQFTPELQTPAFTVQQVDEFIYQIVRREKPGF